MENTDVCLDLNGYPMNFKYQPDVAKYGSEYCGYKSWNEEAFFYEFATGRLRRTEQRPLVPSFNN